MTITFDLIVRLFDAKRAAALLYDDLGFDKTNDEMMTVLRVANHAYHKNKIDSDQFFEIREKIADFLGVSVNSLRIPFGS